MLRGKTGTRTPDILVANQALYQLSYLPMNAHRDGNDLSASDSSDLRFLACGPARWILLSDAPFEELPRADALCHRQGSNLRPLD